MYKPHTVCRACEYGKQQGPPGIKINPTEEKLLEVLDLGIQPLANDFRKGDEERSGFAPLKLLWCPRCYLGQLSVTVDPKILYSNYSYVTSPSLTMTDHFQTIMADIQNEIGSDYKNKMVLEIGSNDGLLLSHFKDAGAEVLGIDPATNLALLAHSRGVNTLAMLMNSETALYAKSIMCPYASRNISLIIARHVFCHVDDWKSFMQSIELICGEETLICIEVPYIRNLIEGVEFDTIYHEHLSYLSIHSIEALLKDTGLYLHKIIRYPVHGGAIMLMLRNRHFNVQRHQSVDEFLDSEKEEFFDWTSFRIATMQKIYDLRTFVEDAVGDGKRVCGYGASAKSTVWINACKFSRRQLSFITDTTIQKQWSFSPGTDIPVVDPGAILRELPDQAVCFAWNYMDEILKKEKQAQDAGVEFINPFHLQMDQVSIKA